MSVNKFMFITYWLISEDRKRIYVGFSDDLRARIKQHKNKKVKSTKDFGSFRCFKLEEAGDYIEARNREKYWKSAVGRKKLKIFYDKIIDKPLSSSG